MVFGFTYYINFGVILTGEVLYLSAKYSIGRRQMKKQTRSILQELNHLNLNRDKGSLISTSGQNLIDSCVNLLRQINETYEPKQALELERRFINAIKSGDVRKFKRGVDKINEDRK